MKQYFYFYFDKKNNLHCYNSYKGLHRKLKNSDAISKLDYIDSQKYNKVTINADKINLDGNDSNVTIDGINKFYDLNYDYNIQKTERKLNSHIRYKLARSNNFDLNGVNLSFLSFRCRSKIAAKIGVITLLTGSFLAMTAYTNKSIDQDLVPNQIVYDKNIADEVIDYSVNYYYEPEDFEILPENYEDFDGYTNETSDAYDNYYDIVKEESERWGVDPNLVMAMLIQESHGKGTNIMQISYSAWNGGKVKLYDFVDNKYVEILFTNNESLETEDKMCITSEEFKDPRMNIRMACAILRHSIERMDNHIIAGLQNYNFGDGNMDSVINHATSDLNMSKEELLADQDNLDFANYVNYASGGDKHYIQNVLQYVKDVDEIYYLDINEFGNIEEYRYNISVKELTK